MAPSATFHALALGYAGASHKNCKGIVKGLANAALLRDRRAFRGEVVLTGEDLANLGPVALLQDLSMMALLGSRTRRTERPLLLSRPEHVSERLAGGGARRAWRPVSASRGGLCRLRVVAGRLARSTRRHSGSRRLSIRQCSSGLGDRVNPWPSSKQLPSSQRATSVARPTVRVTRTVDAAPQVPRPMLGAKTPATGPSNHAHRRRQSHRLLVPAATSSR